jgi:hypothetical protein
MRKKSVQTLLIIVLLILISLPIIVVMYRVSLSENVNKMKGSANKMIKEVNSLESSSKKVSIISDGVVDSEFLNNLENKLSIRNIQYFKEDKNSVSNEYVIYFLNNPQYVSSIVTKPGSNVYVSTSNQNLKKYKTVNHITDGEFSQGFTASENFYTIEDKQFFFTFSLFSTSTSGEESDKSLYLITNYFKSKPVTVNVCGLSNNQQIKADGSVFTVNKNDCKTLVSVSEISSEEPFVLVINPGKKEGRIINLLGIKDFSIPFSFSDNELICNLEDSEIVINSIYDIGGGECYITSGNVVLTFSNAKDLIFYPEGERFSFCVSCFNRGF